MKEISKLLNIEKKYPKEISNNKSEIIIPIEHSIVDGVYTRIAYAKAGTIIVGCPHKQGGTAILLSGTIQQVDGDIKYEITAPRIFNTKAGTQRIARTLTDTIYATCHSTIAKTVEEAESLIFDGVPQITRIRNSYNNLLLEMKMTDEEVHAEMESLPCIIELSEKYVIADSAISGKGCFTTKRYKIGESLGLAVKDGQRMALSRFINHSDIPNCEFITDKNGDTELIVIQEMEHNMEIFVNYRETKVVSCQQ